ncbi:PepSY-associated TM helix domain-containing protein [Crenothrix polyspora]|uniref:Putative iron-regulated membrane protein n=1 Tax=Crenothrix polyspora TaxID=360316 RepID=A0A1R4H8E2_9GAMM|nr:PepSY-associated TM helix domain-containing protein [Crenothrix polyspora]SJM92504.1 putative iron-regulated membrane protein [Crenothrix polyspora]
MKNNPDVKQTHNIPVPKADRSQWVSLKVRRRFWLDIHLWLGLVLGLFISIFGITGSILVFNAEINELLNPKLMTVAIPDHNPTYKPLGNIFQAGEMAMPKNAVHTGGTYPRNNGAAFKDNYLLPINTNVTESWEVYINPYTAEVIGKQLMSSSDSPFPKTFISFIFELHYALFLDEDPGYLIVGAMGALLIISVLSGLILWWPLTGKWLPAMTIKRKASVERLNFDLHKTFGFYSTVVLIPVLFSGVYMDVPEHVVPVLELFSPVTYRYWFNSTPKPDSKAITMADAVAIANTRYPTGRADWLYGATTPISTYTVCKNGVEAAGSFLHRRCVVIDQYSGVILDVDDPSIGTAGEVFTHWQWPLHSGQAFGWTGRILVFLSGLACPVLFVTGVIRWLQKRRAKRYHLSKALLNNLTEHYDAQ